MAQQPGRSPAKYRQIAADLLARIEAGEFPVGSQLPTKPELIAHYRAALGTIDHALAELRQIGVTESQQGVGTFVVGQHAKAGGPDAVSGLRDEVRKLADRVESLELNLSDLYGKQGYDYPREDTGQDEDSGRRVAHDRRA